MFRSSQFALDKGLGRVALAAFGLGFAMALHVALLAVYGASLWTAPDDVSDRWHCLGLWSVYVVALCFFHLAEFMLTASFKPQDVSYECTSLRS
jgi:protein-S-isoprenylcysteine O-methyltransferase